jgi:hypothetical protein
MTVRLIFYQYNQATVAESFADRSWVFLHADSKAEEAITMILDYG